jgi:hypothetical protein
MFDLMRKSETYHSLKSPACICVSNHVASLIVNADHGIM